MSIDVRTPEEGGSINDSVIRTSYYTPNVASIGDVRIIPGSTLHPKKRIESYAYFAKPGVYYVDEGQKFVLAEVEDIAYEISVESLPARSKN